MDHPDNILKPSEPPKKRPSRQSIPSLSQLAIKYGTITKDQLKEAHEERQKREAKGQKIKLDAIFIEKKMATPYQINLLQLIQEFILVKKRSQQFGQIAVHKGYATQDEVDLALVRQQQLFRDSKVQKMLGDLLVEFGIITESQRQIVSEEQKRLEDISLSPLNSRNSQEDVHPPSNDTPQEDESQGTSHDAVTFNQAEQDFIKLKALDTDFALRVLEKRFASVDAVEKAMTAQNRWFDKFRKLHLLGDIMVAEGVLTKKQKLVILSEQKRLDDEIPSLSPLGKTIPATLPLLSNNNSDEHVEQLAEDSAPKKDKNRTPPPPSSLSAPPEPDTQGIFVHLSESRMEAWVTLPEPLRTAPSHEDDDGLLEDAEKFEKIENNGLVMPPDTAKHESLGTIKNKDFHIQEIKDHDGDPPDDHKKSISSAAIREAVKKHGVTQGILSDAFIQCHIDNNDITFPAALGTYTFSSRPEYLFDIHQSRFDGSVQPIKRNKTLAYLNENQTTLQMVDVKGNTLPKIQVSPNRALLRCGNGVVLSEKGERVLSAKGGYPALSIEEKIYLFPSLNVLGDADAKYGPLDPYTDISVSGTLTGAYKVMAGSVRASEIRGCMLEALGDITADLGIIGCTIITQGSVRAKYIHNCRIEAFGDVMPEHELIDSTLIISGRCHGPHSRIIASTITAKQGVTAAGIGSDVTEPCEISVGREDHLLGQSHQITRQMEADKKAIETLKQKKDALAQRSEKLFKKMVDLKQLHDRAQKKSDQFNRKMEKGAIQGDDAQKKTRHLIEALNEKMSTAIASLRRYNTQKKQLDTHINKVILTLKGAKIKVEKKTFFLELDRKRLYQWADAHGPQPEIVVSGRIVQGTIITGQFSTTPLKKDYQHVQIIEVGEKNNPDSYRIDITPMGSPNSPAAVSSHP